MTWHNLVPLLAILALSGCAGQQVTAPAQPTPASIQTANTQLAAITSDPATTWRVGDYAVRQACHAYLNSAAQQSANLNLASVGVGVVGAGMSVVNPLAGVASTVVQSLISAFNASGAIPYTPETSTIIMNSLNAEEAGVEMAPPTDQATALSLTDDLWFLCSPGGYAMTAAQAISTAQIGVAGTSASPAQFRSNAGAAPRFSRPVITVNGR